MPPPPTLPPIHHLPHLHDPFSALSHLLGAAIFLFLSILLLLRTRRSPASHHVSLAIFATSAILCLAASGLYHTTPSNTPAHQFLLRLDHAAIFVLIAGTFTPAHTILFTGPLRYGPLIIIWSAALAGVTLKTSRLTIPESVSLTLYLTLGWLGAVTGIILARRRGFRFTLPLLLGGIAYSAGALADFLNRPNPIPTLLHAHELFHLAVLAGLSFHFYFIWQIATPHSNLNQITLSSTHQ